MWDRVLITVQSIDRLRPKFLWHWHLINNFMRLVNVIFVMTNDK